MNKFQKWRYQKSPNWRETCIWSQPSDTSNHPQNRCNGFWTLRMSVWWCSGRTSRSLIIPTSALAAVQLKSRLYSFGGIILFISVSMRRGGSTIQNSIEESTLLCDGRRNALSRMPKPLEKFTSFLRRMENGEGRGQRNLLSTRYKFIEWLSVI